MYQRVCDRHPTVPEVPCSEESDVVLIPAGGDFDSRNPGAGEVVIPPLQLPDDSDVGYPFRVTWSPDGTELLYTAWGLGADGQSLIAVPLDSSSPPVLLYQGGDENDISIYDGDALLPTQVWANRTGE